MASVGSDVQMNISRLPNTLLSHILVNYLDCSDRKACRLVNKLWYDLSVSDKLLSERSTFIWNINKLAELHPFHNYANLIVQDCLRNEVDQKVIDFLSSCGDYVKSLKLRVEQLNNPEFAQLVSHLPNLKNLDILCENLTAEQEIPLVLPRLETLSFEISDHGRIEGRGWAIFLKAFSNTPMIKRLKVIIGVDIFGELNSLNDFFVEKAAKFAQIQCTVNISDKTNLESLETLSPFITGFHFWGVAADFETSLSDSNFSYIADTFRNLQHLDWLGSEAISEECLQAKLPVLMKQITRVNFECRPMDLVVSSIANISSQLVGLQITTLRGSEEIKLLQNMNTVFEKLKDLRLRFMQFPDTDLNLILKNFPHVTFLELWLNRCRCNADKVWSAVTDNCPMLTDAIFMLRQPCIVADLSGLKKLVKLTRLACEFTTSNAQVLTSLELPKLWLLKCKCYHRYDEDEENDSQSVYFEGVVRNCPALRLIIDDSGEAADRKIGQCRFRKNFKLDEIPLTMNSEGRNFSFSLDQSPPESK